MNAFRLSFCGMMILAVVFVGNVAAVNDTRTQLTNAAGGLLTHPVASVALEKALHDNGYKGNTALAAQAAGSATRHAIHRFKTDNSNPTDVVTSTAAFFVTNGALRAVADVLHENGGKTIGKKIDNALPETVVTDLARRLYPIAKETAYDALTAFLVMSLFSMMQSSGSN